MLDRGMLQAYSATLAMAVLPIIMGSFSSLRTSKRTSRLLREQAGEEMPVEEEEEDVERITFEDAWLFPLVGSALLGGLWLVFKYLDKTWINWFLGWYFTLAGVLTVFKTTSAVLGFFTPGFIARHLPLYSVEIRNRTSRLLDLKLPFLTLPAVPLALWIPYVYSRTPHPWWASNVLSFTFAHSAIGLMALDSFPTAFTLLAGLFAYDLFWVFGSPWVVGSSVMVDVAKGLEAPVKMVFPKDEGWSTAKGFTMLGLGDIIIPGIVIALALRFDYSLATRATPDTPRLPSSPFPKPYFLTAMVGYVAGLACTIWVMHTFEAAQPALLYLVPACIGSILLVALVKRELPLIWTWTDAEDDERELARTHAAEGGEEAPAVEEEEGHTQTSAEVVKAAATEMPDEDVREEKVDLPVSPPPRREGLRSRSRA